MSFLDDHYLLACSAARDLYESVRDLPILDPHNHADVGEIVRNENWSDLWAVEGATDHYVWELMRRRGVPEERITGTACNREKWLALAGVFPDLAGNPTYEWIHLDLRRRFEIQEVISTQSAEAIWEESLTRLQEPSMRPQGALKAMQVEIMCTTDDPTLRLPDHEQAQEAVEFTRILPTWRPDKAMNIQSAGWKSFVEGLCSQAGSDPSQLTGLEDALAASHRYFQRMGCVASDHGLSRPATRFVNRTTAATIYSKAFSGSNLEIKDIQDFQAYLLNLCGGLNREAGWVMQLHIGPVRDYRTALFRDLGPDSGGDISTQNVDLDEGLHHFFNEFDGALKIVLYTVDPTHWPTIATLARAFPNISLGSAWWFNDSPFGMEMQLKYLATVDLLRNHAGMVTDSRKLISFGSRTEMFRRVLCQVVGEMIERGQMPSGPGLSIVEKLCYQRPYELFFA